MTTPSPDSAEMVAAAITVSGRVQGVGYRFFTERLAADLDIKGWSMNLADGRVGLEVEGEKGRVQKFIRELKVGPRMAVVSTVAVDYMPFQGKYSGFSIRF